MSSAQRAGGGRKGAELAHGAVKLNGWQLQVLGNVRVLDGAGLVERLALEPFSGI